MPSQHKCQKQIVKLTTLKNEKGCSIIKKNNLVRTKWTSEEDKQLRANVSQFGHRWLQIAQNMENRNASQCCQRWKRIRLWQGQKLNKAKRWTQQEDETLLRILKKVGPSWNTIANLMKVKSGKQVRRRFKNVLDPTLNHQPITEAEDQIIYQEYLKYGSQWSKISEKLPGRSENMIKNRFYSHIKLKYLNQPNLYFKVRPLDEDVIGMNSNNFQEEENNFLVNQSQAQDDQDLYIDSNEISDDDESNIQWNFETKEHILQTLK